jgi:hypothetical protein
MFPFVVSWLQEIFILSEICSSTVFLVMCKVKKGIVTPDRSKPSRHGKVEVRAL